MEDLIGVRVVTDAGKVYGFMTWGRIGGRIKDAWVRDLLEHKASAFEIEGAVAKVEVCDSLQGVASAPYFFEAMFSFANKGIPFGSGYKAWRKRRTKELKDGAIDLYFLGELGAADDRVDAESSS